MIKFKKNITLAVIALSCFCSNAIAQETGGGPAEGKYTALVNPFIGTAPLLDTKIIGYTPPSDMRVWAGLVFPGSSVPNAMVQLSPITKYRSGAGYEYEDTSILGFTHTNKGHWNLCHLPLLPVPEGVSFPYKSSFSHTQEKGSPAYYEVYLKEYEVLVKLTSTLRCGVHEYTFKNNRGRKVLFDLGTANNHVDDWQIKQEGTNAVSGFQRTGGEKIYFYATLSSAIDKLDIKDMAKSGGYALVNIKDGDANPVTVKIALSFVSTENAAENLKAEVGNKTLSQVFEEGSTTWENLLSKIQVKGGSKQQDVMFYSMLYRSFLWPALRSDVNGQFTDEAGKVRKENYRYYTLPSLWDDYRNKLVLLSIMSPDVTNDVINSIINEGEIKGFIPTFFHGDHAASFIAGSYLRGIRDYDVNKAYKLLLNNAYKEGGTRPYISEYIAKGYISEPDIKDPKIETKAHAGVTKTLEYAYDDHALSLLAKELNDTEHYTDLVKRSKNYANVFDKSTNFMRGRLEDGKWIIPFNPEFPYYEYMYREANAWQVSFYVPHDMKGLVKLYGGEKAFEAKLDTLFTKPWNPDYIAWNISGFIGQYCHGNQPDHEAPFSYYFVNKPEKSQKRIDQILDTMYGIGPEKLAMCGMDDAGEMSSWYVFGALGLYPLSPADPEYIVTVPIFKEVDWTMPTGKKLTITNPNGKRDLKSIKVNGSKINGYFISHDLFKNGGKIEVQTK
ncbi:GH92 family glycosyl hydrolase [Flavobacterium sp. NRK1]|uniref:GH92 family glycosyl hydrolase n=1 Tax=Flavobacterium sp. NRK1 TaxID=2954929 RepID=UPI00209225A2|nr:GH92 family glycosyl hydrolase [Flavobacterium sp. NRK1]MCO6149702.1 GH92 family glycosyl hydrolase [Flavobacterium sp. NRK1]